MNQMQVLTRSADQMTPDFYPPLWLVIVAALAVLLLIGRNTSVGAGAVLGGVFGLGTFLLVILRTMIWMLNNSGPTAEGLELLSQLSIALAVWIGLFGLIGMLARE